MNGARQLDPEDRQALIVSLPVKMREWGAALGFSQIGVADVDLASAEPGLRSWLDNGCHGEMDYMRGCNAISPRPAAPSWAGSRPMRSSSPRGAGR